MQKKARTKLAGLSLLELLRARPKLRTAIFTSMHLVIGEPSSLFFDVGDFSHERSEDLGKIFENELIKPVLTANAFFRFFGANKFGLANGDYLFFRPKAFV